MEENDSDKITRLGEYYNLAVELHAECVNKLIPAVAPSDILSCSQRGATLFWYAKRVIGHITALSHGVLDWQQFEHINLWEQSVCAEGNSGPLRSWGQLLDIDRGKADRKWETFCTSILATGSDKLREIEGSDQRRAWFRDYPDDLIRSFYRRSVLLIRKVEEVLLSAIWGLGKSLSPYVRLVLIEHQLRELKVAFFRNAQVIGPYLPNEENDWQCYAGAIRVVLDALPGILKCRIGGYNAKHCEARCEFVPRAGDAHEWTIDLCPERVGPSLCDYEDMLFRTWHYPTGSYLNSSQDEGRAKWFIDDPADLRYAASLAEHALLPLFLDQEYAHLAETTAEVITDGLSDWYNGPVEWHYVRRLDDVIRSVRLARKVLRLRIEPQDSGTSPEPTLQKAPSRCAIPLEHQTHRMPKSEMADLFGRGTTIDDITTMIDNGTLVVHALNRQSYIFDKRCLPPAVVKKLDQTR